MKIQCLVLKCGHLSLSSTMPRTITKSLQPRAKDI
jgi:hypothetical protein